MCVARFDFGLGLWYVVCFSYCLFVQVCLSSVCFWLLVIDILICLICVVRLTLLSCVCGCVEVIWVLTVFVLSGLGLLCALLCGVVLGVFLLVLGLLWLGVNWTLWYVLFLMCCCVYCGLT